MTQSNNYNVILNDKKHNKPVCAVFHNFGVGQVQYIDSIDGQDNISNLQATAFSWCVWLNGRNYNGPRTVDPEPKFAPDPHDFDILIAFCKIINVINWRQIYFIFCLMVETTAQLVLPNVRSRIRLYITALDFLWTILWVIAWYFFRNSRSLCVDSTDSERCNGTILLSEM